MTAVVWSISGAGDMLIRLCDGHTQPVLGISFIPSVTLGARNSFVATAGGDGTLLVWDSDNGTIVATMTGQHKSAINTLSVRKLGMTEWIPTGRSTEPKPSRQRVAIVTGGSDGRVIQWYPGGRRWERLNRFTMDPTSQKVIGDEPMPGMVSARRRFCIVFQTCVSFSAQCLVDRSVSGIGNGEPTF